MVLALLDAGEKVVVLDDLSTGFRWAVPSGAVFVEGDFGDEALVMQLCVEHGIDAIAHFGAKIVVPESLIDPIGYYLNNTAKAGVLIACAVKAGIKHFIFSSTAAVYGIPAVSPILEDVPLSPINPYGRSKLAVEWMLADSMKAYGLSSVVLRYFNVAGADPEGRLGQSSPNATHLVKIAVQAALGHRDGMNIFGTDYTTPDGSCIRDYIQVADLAAAHMRALDYLRAGGSSVTCNCGYGHGLSVLEIIDVVKSVSGVDFPVRIAGRRAGDPPSLVADATRIRNVLGWKPRHDDVRGIVKQAMDWERRLHDREKADSR
jgi:UDP-glucose 4-epimerase